MTGTSQQDRERRESSPPAPPVLTITSSDIERLNPGGLPPVAGYCQVTVARGTRTVHVSGQVGIDADGELAGPDHRSQIEQAIRNLQLALAGGGASIEQVVKSTFYVVDYSPEVMGSLAEASTAVFGTQPPVFAVTLVGVATLADPRFKVEIEATAVLP
ncbi:MAG: RidA family protein [Geodermatophilaceae bacterium]|nr:RidA family protein [Geodermatophilaceae bacterium]